MRYSILTAIFAVSVIACSDAATEQSTQLKKAQVKASVAEPIKQVGNVDRSAINQAHSKLNQLISNTECDSSSQCQAIAVGSRACGGPSSYAIFSSKNVNSDEVTKLASEITTLESQYNAANDMMSICQHLTKPATQCVANKCVKVPGSPTSVY